MRHGVGLKTNAMHNIKRSHYDSSHPLEGSISPLPRPRSPGREACSHDMLALSSNPALTPSMPTGMTHVQPSAGGLYGRSPRP